MFNGPISHTNAVNIKSIVTIQKVKWANIPSSNVQWANIPFNNVQWDNMPFNKSSMHKCSIIRITMHSHLKDMKMRYMCHK